MNYQNNEIWNNSILIFDSCSILRLYEWCINKSLELKDIFDCKTQDILLLQHVKKETMGIYDQRIEQKKNKHYEAINYISDSSNKEKALNSLKKQCDGHKFSSEFLDLLKNYVDDKTTYNDAISHVSKNDAQGNLYIEENKLDALLKIFFSREFATQMTLEQIEQKYTADIGKGLPGYKDNNKTNNMQGDYIILNQLVEVSNSTDKNITFITADVKSDWFPYNKATNQKEVNPKLENWFSSEITSESKISVITLTDMLKIAKTYISDDIRSLVDETIIFSLVDESYGVWYPDDLMDKVTEYIEEDRNIQLEIEHAIDCCLDNLEFGENESYDIKDIEYEIDGDEVLVNIYIDLYLTLDASAHCANEDFDLGSPSCHFSGLVQGRIPIDWESNDTGAISIGSQLEDITIESIDFIGANSLYEENDCEPGHDEPDYDDTTTIDKMMSDQLISSAQPLNLN